MFPKMRSFSVFASRLLLQGLATNTHLCGLELDLSSCEVHSKPAHPNAKLCACRFWLSLNSKSVCSCVRLGPRWYRSTSPRRQQSEAWISLTTVGRTTLRSALCPPQLLSSARAQPCGTPCIDPGPNGSEMQTALLYHTTIRKYLYILSLPPLFRFK